MMNTCSYRRIAFAGVENFALLEVEIEKCRHAIQTECMYTGKRFNLKNKQRIFVTAL